MATKNFTQFNTATPLTTSDYIVGYNAAGTAEIKTQVQSIINLVGETDSQTLTYSEGTKELSISSGNTVSLSSLSDTAFQNASGNWQSTYTTFQSNSSFYIQSRSTLETPTTGISAVSNIVFLKQATYNALNVKLSTTMYVIVSA